jgi:membrane protease YdiL (CAAX protease family)
MSKRLAHFRANVGWADVFKTSLIATLSLGFAIFNPEPPFSAIVVSLALCLPALFRGILAASPELWSNLLAKGAILLFALAFLLPMFKSRIEGIAGVPTAIFGLLAAYASAFFWLWSDPDVISLKKQ